MQPENRNMEHMQSNAQSHGMQKKPWGKPKIEAIIDVTETAGGPATKAGVENGIYQPS